MIGSFQNKKALLVGNGVNRIEETSEDSLEWGKLFVV